MPKITIVSSKYDGSLRDVYEGFVYAEGAERIVVYTPAGTSSYDYRKQRRVEMTDGMLELYFKNRWYNVWHICTQQTHVNRMYINLTMPTRFTTSGIAWVDLDIDYRVHLDGRIERLDDDEYETHCVSMGYPPDVQAQVAAACIEIETLLPQRLYPFDHDEQIALYEQITTLAQSSHNQEVSI